MSNVSLKTGDLFKSKAQTLVNTVNCVGVMGKGIAVGFKKRFPEMFDDYVARCESGKVRLGRPYLYRYSNGPWILNFPTKDYWRSVSRVTDIIDGLEYLESHHKEWGIESLAVPPLGCGSGQLDWKVVGPTLYRYLTRLEIPVELFAPSDTPNDQLRLEFLEREAAGAGKNQSEKAEIDPAALAIVSVVSRINREPYHWPVGRVALQKIAYFVTEAGVPTGLKHERGSYGPFASGLKRLTTRLVNNGLLTETKIGAMFVASPGPTYRDARDQYKEHLRSWVPAIEKVADLFLRLPRSEDAEIVATVHFVAKELKDKSESGLPSELEVFEEVKRWKVRRRPPMKDDQIAATVRYLNILSWLNLKASDELPLPSDDEVLA